jgi:hypothetical protein
VGDDGAVTDAVVGQLATVDAYFRTMTDGQMQFGHLRLADEHLTELPLRLEHDLSIDTAIGRVLHIERHPRAGV